MCAYGVYKRKGGPVVLTILLFQKILSTIYMCMEMEILVVFISGIQSKKCSQKNSWYVRIGGVLDLVDTASKTIIYSF